MATKYVPIAVLSQWASAQHVSANFQATVIGDTVKVAHDVDDDDTYQESEVWCTSDSMCSLGLHCVGNKCRSAPEWNTPDSLACHAKTVIDDIREPQYCKFPFKVDGHWFTQCTSYMTGEFACATQISHDGSAAEIAECHCQDAEHDSCGSFVTWKGEPCVPFNAGDETYHRCKVDSGDRRPWCGTEVDDGLDYEEWDWCQCQCQKDADCPINERCSNGKCEEIPCRGKHTEERASCHFPYKAYSDGDWIYSCSREDAEEEMWCATTVDEDGLYDDWGYCNCETCDETLRGWYDVDYRGCQDHTHNGKKCQKWTSQYPHQSECMDENNELTGCDSEEEGLGDHNYCRSPSMDSLDGGHHGTIWCYTMDPHVKWDYCTPKSETFVGDPIITVNGHKTKVDLPHGHKTLMWKDDKVEILSKADVRTPDGKNQWFSQFFVKANSEELLQVSVAANHEVEITSRGKNLAQPGRYELGHDLVVDISAEQVVSVISSGISFTLLSAKAKKFLPNVEKAKRYTHLDLRIQNMDDKVVKDGILAELYGFIPISLQTAGMISHISSMQ